MLATLFVMTMLGCSDTGEHCEMVKTLPRQYSSIESCRSSTDSVLSNQSSSEYPVTMIHCAAIGDKTLKIAELPPAQQAPQTPAINTPTQPAVIAATPMPSKTTIQPPVEHRVLPNIPGLKDAANSIVWLSESTVSLAKKTTDVVEQQWNDSYDRLSRLGRFE